VKAYNNRGGVYVVLQKYELALDDFNQALALTPDYAKAYNNRAYVYAKMGKYDQAIDDVNQALTVGPEEAMFYDTRGYAYAGKGMLAEALKDFDLALGMDQTLETAYLHRAEVYDRTGEQDAAKMDYTAYIRFAREDKNDADLATAKRRLTQLSQMAPDFK